MTVLIKYRNFFLSFFFTYVSLKYSLEATTSGFIVFFPGFQPAGHTSPCLSVYWNA